MIEQWIRGAVPVAQDEQDRRRERRLNHENEMYPRSSMSSIEGM